MENGKGKENLPQFSPEQLNIPTKSLDELINYHATKTVGKVLKRVEICDNKDSLKAQIKEILYESYRDFRDLLISINYGFHLSIFNFKNPENKEERNKNGRS